MITMVLVVDAKKITTKDDFKNAWWEVTAMTIMMGITERLMVVVVAVAAVNSAVDVKKTTKMIKVVVAVVMVMMMMAITMVLIVDAKKITTKSNDR